MIRVFPRRNKWTPTDEMAFVGDPPESRPPANIPVRVSVTFTWDIPEGRRLLAAWSRCYSDVRLGGPALDDPGSEFVPGRFVYEGVTITSRGCPNKCSFCFVPKREGRIRELPIQAGWIIQDNNLLACSDRHIEAVVEMLSQQKNAVCFNGGLDSRLFSDRHIKLFSRLRVHEYWFACDSTPALGPLRRVASMLSHVSINKKRCYVMVGFHESIAVAESRLQQVFNMGFLPFAQLYRNLEPAAYSPEWRALARYWSRPAIYCSHAK